MSRPERQGSAAAGADGNSGGSAAAGDRRAWLTLAHGAMLLVGLGFLRVEKAVYLKLDLGLWAWAGLFLPELGLVLALTGAGLLLARAKIRWAAVAWWSLFPLLVLATYALAVADHVFFLHTGTRLQLDLLSYAVGNLRMLSGVLGTGVDAVLWWRIALMLCCLTLASLWGWRRRRPAPGRAAPRNVLAVAVGAVLATGVLTPLEGALSMLELSAVPEFFHGALSGPNLPAESLQTIPPEEIYSAPEIVTAGERPPDIVLVILESTRAEALENPALAEIAERAVVFDTAYAGVTHTSKALIGMLCGMYPRLEMPIVETLDGNLPFTCLPEILHDAGYRTAFLQTASGYFENRPGLVRNMGFGQAAFRETLDRGRFERVGYFGLDEFAMLEPAVDWAVHGGPEPYLLTLLTVIPHQPYEVPGQGDAWLGQTLEQYREAVRYQDRFVGALVEALQARGALDDGVVLIVGDHGEAFGEHRLRLHDVVPYEEVVRVPLLILGPEERIGPPRRVGGLRHHLDLVPTVLNLTGAEWRGRLLGRDLLGTDGHPRVVTSCWYTDYCLSMREADRKVVFHYWRRPTEVFDLGRDPGERHNLAPEMPQREVREAERRLLALKQSVDDFHARHPVQEGPELWWSRRVE